MFWEFYWVFLCLVVDSHVYSQPPFLVPADPGAIADGIVQIVLEIDKNVDRNGMIVAFAEDEQIQKKN